MVYITMYSVFMKGNFLMKTDIQIANEAKMLPIAEIAKELDVKDDVKEVAQGYECGVGLERFNDIKIGDVLEAFIMEEIER